MPMKVWDLTFRFELPITLVKCHLINSKPCYESSTAAMKQIARSA